jgi:nucleotide-binding universal stress UspA family protein
MFQRILVPVDGSEHSLRAVDAAAELARKFGGSLLLLTVWRHHSPLEASLSMVRSGRSPVSPDAAMKAYAIETVEQAKARATEAGVEKVEGFVMRGQPAREIVAFAKQREADAIVMGARGDGDVSGFLLGSVSHKVGGLSPVTCVLVK